MNETLLYAGQYILLEASIIQSGGLALDVRDQIQLITIYEDMFSPFMSGNLVMLDSVDLPSMFLNSGTDLFKLKIKTPTITSEYVIERTFHIYKLNDRTQTAERAQTYSYHFVSIESLVNSSRNLSKTYRGKAESNIATILKDIFKTSLSFNYDSTSNDITYTSNYWDPVTNIAYNSDHALSSNGIPCMMFYENRFGFNFKSLVDVYNIKPNLAFSASNNLSQIKENAYNIGDTFKDLNKDYENISNVIVNTTYDYYTDKNNGLMSSRMFSFDLTTKKLVDITYNANSDNRARPNPNVFYSKSVIDSSYSGSNSTVKLHHVKHNKLYDGKTDVSDFSFKQRRVALMRNFQQHKIEITVLGRTDYTVGMSIHVDVNKLRTFNRETDRGTISDPMLSGVYVVSAVCHRFGRDGKHESTFECIRDSINKEN